MRLWKTNKTACIAQKVACNQQSWQKKYVRKNKNEKHVRDAIVDALISVHPEAPP